MTNALLLALTASAATTTSAYMLVHPGYGLSSPFASSLFDPFEDTAVGKLMNRHMATANDHHQQLNRRLQQQNRHLHEHIQELSSAFEELFHDNFEQVQLPDNYFDETTSAVDKNAKKTEAKKTDINSDDDECFTPASELIDIQGTPYGVLEVEMPGVPQDGVSVELKPIEGSWADGAVMEVRGQAPVTAAATSRRCYNDDYLLSADINTDNVDAIFENGLLTITLEQTDEEEQEQAEEQAAEYIKEQQERAEEQQVKDVKEQLMSLLNKIHDNDAAAEATPRGQAAVPPVQHEIDNEVADADAASTRPDFGSDDRVVPQPASPSQQSADEEIQDIDTIDLDDRKPVAQAAKKAAAKQSLKDIVAAAVAAAAEKNKARAAPPAPRQTAPPQQVSRKIL